MSKQKDRDFTVIARRTVEQAIGEHLDGSLLADPNEAKNPAAIVRGRAKRRIRKKDCLVCKTPITHSQESCKDTLKSYTGY